VLHLFILPLYSSWYSFVIVLYKNLKFYAAVSKDLAIVLAVKLFIVAGLRHLFA